MDAAAAAAAAALGDVYSNDAANGIYHATSQTKIVFFGDLEGNSLKKLLRPEGANPESSTNVLMPTVSNLTELDPYLTVDQDNLILQSDVILVCLGDVIGDGPDNIELARTLLKLKEDNPTRVILISGNRDVNKVRLGHELEPTDVCMAELTGRVEAFVGSKSVEGFANFKFEFKRNNPDDFNYLWGNNHEIISKISTCLERVIQITERSMGESCAWKFLVDEYLRKKGFTPEQLTSSSISDKDKSYIYVYLVQVMSGAIKCDVPEINNIFEELLMAGHLMACIKTPDRGTFGLMHSLPPRMLIPTDPGRIFTEQYDKPVKDAQVITDADIKSSNKLELNVGLVKFNSYVKTLLSTAMRSKSPNEMRQLLEFVSGITSGSFDVYNGTNSFSGLNLPVSWQTFNKAGFELLAKTAQIQTGGKMDDLKKNAQAVNHIDMKDFSRIICSHKPQGYIGAKVKFGNQLYYCVDVSKIDEQDYDTKDRYGCCFLVIDLSQLNVKDDAFIGRIMMKQTQFPDNHNVFRDNPISPYPFDNKQSLYVNYIQSPISAWNLSDWNNSNPPGNFPQKLKLIYMSEKYEFNFENGPKFTKMPTLKYEGPSEDSPAEMMNYLGGSRTRKRRSKYLKKSARTTHKRRRNSKKLARKNNKRKDKKSVRK